MKDAAKLLAERATPATAAAPTAGWIRKAMIAAVLVLASAHMVVTLLLPAGGTAATWFADISTAVASLIAGGLCLLTAYALPRPVRYGWMLLGAASLCWTLGELVWSWYELVLVDLVPFPSAADVGFLGMYPLTVAGLMVLMGPSRAGLRTLLDGLVITGACLVVSWAVVLGPIYRTDGDPLERILSLCYPAGAVVMASMAVLLLARTADRSRKPIATVATGMIVLVVADAGFAYMTQQGTYASGGPLDSAWLAGFLLIGLGAIQARRNPSVTIQRLRPWVALPYVPVSIALVTMVIDLLDHREDAFAVIVSAAVIVAVMARQVLTLQDNVKLAKRLEHLAFHDSLTGLANRTRFLERAERALVRQAHDNSQLALLYIDLDGFKEVNDRLGHHAGDVLLGAAGRRLQSCVRVTDTVARLGGDEFAVLVTHLNSAEDADALAAGIVTAIADPFWISTSSAEKDPHDGRDARSPSQHRLTGRSVSIGASVGVAVSTQAGEQAGELLRRADVSMYAAKVRGKGRHVRLPAAAEALPPPGAAA